jgi:hypothetical protein
MSEKVQMLAASIYKELERMILKNGQESVKVTWIMETLFDRLFQELMPRVVNVLESLDLAYLDKDEHVVDLEMLKEENEQLLNQYERERQMRKSQEQVSSLWVFLSNGWAFRNIWNKKKCLPSRIETSKENWIMLKAKCEMWN